MNRKPICLAALLFACLSAIARAGFNGQTVTADWYVPDNVTILESHTFVVGPGVELPYGSITNSGNLYQIDMSDSEIRFEFSGHAIFTPVTVNGWNFWDTNNTIPPIINAKLGPMSAGISNLTNAAISFDANSVFGNFQGVAAVGAGDFFTIEVTFGEDLPEPSCAGLIGAAAIMTLRRRRGTRKPALR